MGCWKCVSPRPLVHVPVPSMPVRALVCTLVLPTLRVPLLSLARAIPEVVTGTQLGNGGSSAPTEEMQGETPTLRSANPSPALSQPWGHAGHICVSCASSFKAIHSFAFSSISPFPAEALFITSANNSLTGACEGARIKPPLISPLNNRKPSLTAVKTRA